MNNRLHNFTRALLLAAALAFFTSAAHGVDIEFVTVGNAGNAGDPSPVSQPAGIGAVAYEYRIGTYEVTTEEYVEFLNAVGDTDPDYPNGLYVNIGSSRSMTGRIQRTGSPGTYTYAAIAGYETNAVRSVSWYNAARFVNWLENGQPTGSIGNATTERGVYDLTSSTLAEKCVRVAGANHFLPNKDEWYKAAMHKNDGVTANFWNYPCSNDTAPTASGPTAAANNANWDNVVGYEVAAGAYSGSAGPYGTFDQAGNVCEWTDVNSSFDRNASAGGAWDDYVTGSAAALAGFRDNRADPAGGGPEWEINVAGFRVAAACPGPPVITNATPSGVIWDTAAMNGALTFRGAADTYVWLYWGETDGQDTNSSWQHTNYFGPCLGGALTTNITNLASSTQYFHRYFAGNAYGTAWAAPSSNFITQPSPLDFERGAAGADGYWHGEPANWAPTGTPGQTVADTADIRDRRTVTLAADAHIANLYIGLDGQGGSGTLKHESGTLQVDNYVQCGPGGSNDVGVYKLYAGMLTTPSLRILGGKAIDLAPPLTLDADTYRSGWFVQAGGKVAVDSLDVGYYNHDNPDPAMYLVTGGALDVSNAFRIGPSSGSPCVGIVTQTSGVVTSRVPIRLLQPGCRYDLHGGDLFVTAVTSRPIDFVTGSYVDFRHATGTVHNPADGALFLRGGTDVWDFASLTTMDAAETDFRLNGITVVDGDLRFEKRLIGGNTYTEVSPDGSQYPPVISNVPADNIKWSSADINGYLHYTGGAPTFVWVYWGENNGRDVAADWEHTNAFGQRGAGPISANISGLSQDTRYFYRYCAANAAGTNWAEKSSYFQTSGFTVEMVTIGNVGNAGDLNPAYAPAGIGAVDYEYQIGKYEVSNDEYVEFLTAIGGSDSNGAWSPNMRIVRSGSPPNYTYASEPGYGVHPVRWVSWYNAARFVNWLENGQPTGCRSVESTEQGTYDLTAATLALKTVRAPEARIFLPSKDEWYKAAMHKNDGVTANYWNYPASSDSAPTASGPTATANRANWNNVLGYEVAVGSYSGSAGPYGTFDQAGNLFEWTEANSSSDRNAAAGGAWDAYVTSQSILPNFRDNRADPAGGGPEWEVNVAGFRIATAAGVVIRPTPTADRGTSIQVW